MNEKRGGGGSHRWLLLVIPATVLMAKAMHHRRSESEQGWGPGSWAGRRGHHGWGGPAGAEGDATREFRVPPKIEAMLNTWHDRAHQAVDSAESPIG